MSRNTEEQLCSFQDCNEKSTVTIGKLNAPVCVDHAIIYQTSEGYRN